MRHRLRFGKFSSMWKLGVLLCAIGLLFWLTTGWLDQQVLSQARPSSIRLQAGGTYQVKLSFQLTIVSIDAFVDRTLQISEVSVRALGSTLEELEFKFPVSDSNAVEQAIAQEIKLPVAEIRKLIRYRLHN